MSINAIVDNVTYNGIQTISVGGKTIALEESGGTSGYTADDIVNPAGIGGDIVITFDGSARPYAFVNSAITSVVIENNCANLSMFEGCNELESIIAPKITTLTDKNNFARNCTKLTTVRLPTLRDSGSGIFDGCSSLSAIALPSVRYIFTVHFRDCTSLAVADFGPEVQFIRGEIFKGCSSLGTLILRNANGVSPLSYTNCFNGTPFASGGSGGTIYIPEVMYNHLGDGSSLDYIAASNWNTIYGYGTISWAKIEGSAYETHYADGTSVSA